MKKLFAILALCLGFTAHAADVEVSIGEAFYNKADNGIWWQAGSSSQGFSDNFNLRPMAYSIGMRGDHWRAGYMNLGKATSYASATVMDSDYNLQTQAKTNPNVPMQIYVGASQSDGLYATYVQPVTRGLYVEAGAWAYRTAFTMTTLNPSGATPPYYLDVPAYTGGIGPILGIGYDFGGWSVALTAVWAEQHGKYPSIYFGANGMASIRYKF